MLNLAMPSVGSQCPQRGWRWVVKTSPSASRCRDSGEARPYVGAGAHVPAGGKISLLRPRPALAFPGQRIEIKPTALAR